jgi:tryptophan-rich sensory protein
MAIDLVPTLSIVGAVVAIAALARVGTDTESSWYKGLKKPEWQPSSKLFAPVWFTIYLLLAISAILVWHETTGDMRIRLMILYAINGVLNLAWSFIFFKARSPLVAGIDIVGLAITILLIMVRVWPVSPVASLLLLPYLLWVCFASVLNWAIARMN